MLASGVSALANGIKSRAVRTGLRAGYDRAMVLRLSQRQEFGQTVSKKEFSDRA